MPTNKYFNQVQDLQKILSEARRDRNIETEIEILIQIGQLALSENDLGIAHMHFKLAENVIQNTCVHLEKLHETLGKRALVLRRMKRYKESLDLYEQAATAAKKYSGPHEYAIWVGKQGTIYRLLGDENMSRKSFQTALRLFNDLKAKGLDGVAEQHGNLGLLASDRGDDEIAIECYGRALEIADSAGLQDQINLWGQNLGRTLSRRRRYHEAWGYFEKALNAAIKCQQQNRIYKTAVEWSASYRKAHQYRQSADFLIKTFKLATEPAVKCALLERTIDDLRVAGEWERLLEFENKLLQLLKEQRADKSRLDRCLAIFDFARHRLKEKTIAAKPSSGKPQPTMLDWYVVENMARCVESKDVMGMKEVAHLICDVNLGLLNPTEEAWKKLMSESYLRYRVVGEAMKALCQAGLVEESLELSQRIKSSGFCSVNIEQLQKMGAPHTEAAEYLENIEKLSNAVSYLKSPVTPDVLQRIDAVRAAGEMVLECGEKLRNRDRILLANLGGLVRPKELLDAFPMYDPIAIVDFFVTGEGTIIHILIRSGNKVQVIPYLAPFSTEQAKELLKAWIQCNITQELSEQQIKGLIEIGKILHDRLICELAKDLAKLRVGQIVFVPDTFTSFVPLHLSLVCSEEIEIPGVDTKDATYLGEVFPVEYVPCLQAVAVSQHKKRPRNISYVLALNDPMSDLPGDRSMAKWLGSRLPEMKYTSYVGKRATLSNLFSEMDKSDVVIIGTHGHFDLRQPLKSHLVFNDGLWKMEDILSRKFFENSPVFILSACEVGASEPLSELTLGGLPSGIPGALLSIGAACTLASLWPVEDISMGYLMERFLVHLSHPGYRPSAALFRAIKDLQRLTKDEAIERCNNLLDEMERDGTADKQPEQFIKLDALKVWIEDSVTNHPFSSPQFWGGVAIFGSGWHLPAGGNVVTQDGTSVTNIIDNVLKRKNAIALIAEGKYQEAQEILEQLLQQNEGLEKVRTLEKLAWVKWLGRQKVGAEAIKKEVNRLLKEAEFLAKSEQDEQLLRNIKATKQKISLGEDN